MLKWDPNQFFWDVINHRCHNFIAIDTIRRGCEKSKLFQYDWLKSVHIHPTGNTSSLIYIMRVDSPSFKLLATSIRATLCLILIRNETPFFVCVSRSTSVGYRNWYQYWGHCCLINNLGSSPQPEGEALGLWWASEVVNETTMTELRPRAVVSFRGR